MCAAAGHATSGTGLSKRGSGKQTPSPNAGSLRPYEATVPVYVHGDTSTPHLVLECAGSGKFPRLTFDTPEVLLPPVSWAGGLAVWHGARLCRRRALGDAWCCLKGA